MTGGLFVNLTDLSPLRERTTGAEGSRGFLLQDFYSYFGYINAIQLLASSILENNSSSRDCTNNSRSTEWPSGKAFTQANQVLQEDHFKWEATFTLPYPHGRHDAEHRDYQRRWS